ncbi:hypothetical protein IAD21_04944 [Abditibacteriota bacterium]|nr:hypothetical protein IAD21_04944 [Abditibacteriota bacterium]
MRPIGALIALILAGLMVRGWTQWRYGLASQIERAARAQYIPQLEKQIGQKIEVGRFSTDWLGRLKVEDVVVGRNRSLPTGSLIAAKSVTISLDLAGLALGRTHFPDAITAVDLDSPSLYVRRDTKGQLNLSSLFKPSSGGTGTRWNGRVGFQNGRVFYADDQLRSRQGQALQVDARDVKGAVLVSSPQKDTSAFEFDGRVGQSLLQGQDLGALPLRGRVVSGDKKPTRGWMESQTPFVSAVLASQWVRLPFEASAGSLGGKIQLAFVGNELAPRGELELRQIDVRVPRAGAAPVDVRGLSGPLRFAGTATESAGLTATIVGAKWLAKGRAAFDHGQTIFDGNVATRNLSLANVRALVGPNVLPSQLSAASIDVDAHASGTPQLLHGEGTVVTRDAAWNDGTARRARFPLLRATGVLERTANGPLGYAARFEAPGGELRALVPRAQNVLVRAGQWAGSVRGAGRVLDVNVRAANVAASSSALGKTSATGVRLVASTSDLINGAWRGGLELDRASTAGVRLAALFPKASLIRDSGILSARLNFEGSPRRIQEARASGTLSLSQIALSPEIIPVSAREQVGRVFGPSFDVERYLSARDASAQVSLTDGVLQITRARAQTVGGPVTASFSTPIARFAPRYAFASPSLSVPTALLFDVARARGVELVGDWNAGGSLVGQGDAQRAAVRAVLTLDAPRFQARSTQGNGRITGLGANLRVTADLNSARPRWSAQLLSDSLSIQSGKLGSTGLVIPADLGGTRVVGARVVAASLPDSEAATLNTAWTVNVGATRTAIPLRGINGRPIVTLRDVSALINPRKGGIDVSRVGANWSNSGRIDGTLTLDGEGLRGEILAREVEAQALQTLLANTSMNGARLQGRLNFKASLRPNEAPQMTAQMARGTFILRSGKNDVTLPLRALNVETQTQNGVVSLQNVRAIVDDARVEGNGRVLLNDGRIEANLGVAGVSLAPFAQLLGGSTVPPVAGIARAQVKLRFNTRQNQIALDGQAHLDGGAFRGVSLDQTEATIGASWNLERKEGTLKLSDWRGELEGSPFSGNLSLDTPANAWSVQIAAPKIALRDVARLKARLQNASATDASLQRLAPPVDGKAGLVLDVSGMLRDADDHFVFRPQTGLARLNVPDLQWRARTLGELDGTFRFEDGRLAFDSLRLSPPVSQEGTAPTISLVGSVPLDSRSGPLDARLSVGEAPLDFFLETLREGRDALSASDVSSPFLESVVSYANNLPRGLRGRVALEAQVGGTLASPIFKVSRLGLRDGRAPLPLGGLSFPATFDAAFTFANGEVAIDQATFRLAKKEPNAVTTPAAGAAPPEEEEDDTIVQVQPDSKLSLDGDSSLVADVFNANLSQLAPWVPALRGKNGEAQLKGQLESFSVRLEGPATDPRLTASVDAQNIEFRGVTLERLRVARLDIGDGVAKIEPGNLSVKEGRFESSAASGSVAWSWKTGPVADGALKLQFPFATRDFGALTALFLPGISNASADEFAGTIEVGGTVKAPQFLGDVHIRGGSFQTVSRAASPILVGVQNLNGALRFVNGNRLEIVQDDPISGELVSPESIPVAPTPTPTGTQPKGKGKAKLTKATEENAVRARGAFKLRGSVELGQSDLTQVSADISSAIATNIYNLRLDVSNGRVEAPGTSGLQDAVFAASFVTTDSTHASNTQTVRWIGAGRGTAPGKKLGAGELFTRGVLRLRPDFVSGFPSLARSTPVAWTSVASNLADADAARRAPDSAFEDARPQLVFKEFGVKASGYGSAVVDGQLVLDKAQATNRAPDAARLQTISGKPSLRPYEPVNGARLFGAWKESALVSPLRSRSPLPPRDVQSLGDTENTDLPIRLGGNIVVSSAQIVGGGSGDGQVTRLSFLPDAPRLDIRVSLGRDVELSNATLRARLGGDLALSGTPSNPLLLGTVEVLDGQVRFPNARARIEDGRVSINITRDAETDLPRTRLEVDATARGQAGRYSITLRLRGPLQFDAKDSQNISNLQIDVSSNPALSKDEAFAQLLGVSPRDFSDENGGVNVAQANQAYAQAVLQLVSAPFFSGFERSVAQALGLSSVSFEYRFNEPLAFEISKTLGDRILITYRRSLGPTQTSGGRSPFELRVDYRLKGDLYLGVKLDERQVKTLTLGKSWTF